MFILKIGENDAGQRLDKFLLKSLPNCPASFIYKSIRIKKIKLNRKRTHPEDVLTEGDELQLFISDEYKNKNKSESYKLIKNPDLNVAYEDVNLLICNKKPGVSCHPDSSTDSPTLIDRIKAYLYLKGDYKPEEENSFAPALCNRIDKNTGGLVIAAKNAQTLRDINGKIKNREVIKKYLLIAHGYLKNKSGVLNNILIKDEETNTVRVGGRKDLERGGKTAITEYRVLAEDNNLSLIEATIKTGRTHQIRIQFAEIGHPLLGEGKYAVNREDRKKGYKYQALYSYYLKTDDIEVSLKKSDIYFMSLFPDTLI